MRYTDCRSIARVLPSCRLRGGERDTGSCMEEAGDKEEFGVVEPMEHKMLIM